MSQPCYCLVVKGELGPRYASAFGGMTIRAHDGQTDITGPIIDQPHLHGLLERIASLGLTLHSLTSLETQNARAVPEPHKYNQPGSETTNPGANSKGPT
jgi:hypothetical protein